MPVDLDALTVARQRRVLVLSTNAGVTAGEYSRLMQGRRAGWCIALTVVLSACGSASSPKVQSGILTPSSTESVPCGPERDDCTPAEVTATVQQIYVVRGGATRTEAACLAPITSNGKHAVNQAFDKPQPGETETAIACVGSEDRLRVIVQNVGDYFSALNKGIVPST